MENQLNDFKQNYFQNCFKHVCAKVDIFLQIISSCGSFKFKLITERENTFVVLTCTQ